jgi:hypothetical protein
MPTPSDYSDFRMSKDNSAERGEGKQGVSGEYGQGGPQSPLNGEVPAETYPNPFGYGYDANNREFSNDKSDTPDTMAAETAGNQNAFADLQHFLNNSPYTAGSRVCHELSEPWKPPHGEGSGGPGGRQNRASIKNGNWTGRTISAITGPDCSAAAADRASPYHYI